MDVHEASDDVDAVIDELLSAVVADHEFAETLLTALLARGHVLLEDVPGTGKTVTANALATALGLEFSRIQFTPDMLPADVTGTHVFEEATGEFSFAEGPIFANVVLADEINRAPPKTQAALLEAMEEEQVTVDGETHRLPEPFFVVATQNPVESEGTFELPEAQVDRFLAKTAIGYPDDEGEVELLRRRAGREAQAPTVGQVLDPDRVRELRRVPEGVHVEADLLEYVAAIGRRTRLLPEVETGVSPRGTQRLFEAARARAVLEDRDFVTPDDVRAVAQPALAHRLVLTPEAAVEGVEPERLVESVLEDVPVPTVERSA